MTEKDDTQERIAIALERIADSMAIDLAHSYRFVKILRRNLPKHHPKSIVVTAEEQAWRDVVKDQHIRDINKRESEASAKCREPGDLPSRSVFRFSRMGANMDASGSRLNEVDAHRSVWQLWFVLHMSHMANRKEWNLVDMCDIVNERKRVDTKSEWDLEKTASVAETLKNLDILIPR